MAEIIIDGKACEFSDGEYSLNIARRNGIYIPAICYLSGCSPTLACRLCMVEADGKVVYSCNAKAKDGMEVITNSDEISQNRKAIMQTYCINHPLECGVCDKSGECELQNFTHFAGVDEVPYAIKDTHAPVQNWGLINYEPSLCIVCERCVTVCKDKIGDSALKTVPRGGEQVPKELKDTMPKDAHFVWNRFQKSLIGLASGEDKMSCMECGECVAVCPVGALTQDHFTYSANSWELRKVPSSNPHSSDCELVYYEIKESGITNRTPKIYRVTSDYSFGELNKAARFGFDFHKDMGSKDEVKFKEIIEAFEKKLIRNIKFNSFITNEEAKILSLLKEKYNLNLINDEALAYQNFLKEYSKYSGKGIYTADNETISNSNFIITAGSFLRHDAPNVAFKVNNTIKMNRGGGVYFHTLKDTVVEGFSKNLISVTHSPSIDIEILLFILKTFATDLPIWLMEKIADIEFYELFGINEEEFTKLHHAKENLTLIIGEDFIVSKNAKTLAKLLGLIERYTKFKVMIIPPRTNSLGVAMICELDAEVKTGKVFGYNEKGDFTFDVYKGDLNAPALNQQEGTFLNLDKRVVPINRALPYHGYELNDIAKALGLELEHTIDYTPNLGDKFKKTKFDDLTNYYDNAGVSHRGYKLNDFEVEMKELEELDIENLNPKFDEFIYKANPHGQFSKFTNRASLLQTISYLYAGVDFMQKHSLKDGDTVKLKGISLSVKLDKEIDGAYIGYYDDKVDIDALFDGRYLEGVSFE